MHLLNKSLFAKLYVLLACIFATAASAQVEQAKPWLGVAIDAGKTGVLVKEVIPGTPAEEYGLKAGDEITAVSGKPVQKPEDLIAQVRSQGVGNLVKVDYLRAGKAASKEIRLVARPDDLELVRKKVIGKAAPAVALEAISGIEPGAFDKLKGRVVLLEFWATWCPACRSTHPKLTQWATIHKDIAVLAVSDEETAELKDYVAHAKPSFTVLRDKDHKLHAEWMVSAIPMIVVLDKKGIVQFATIGAGSYLDEALAAAEKLATAS